MVHYSVSAAVGIGDRLVLLSLRPLTVGPQDPDKAQLTRTLAPIKPVPGLQYTNIPFLTLSQPQGRRLRKQDSVGARKHFTVLSIYGQDHASKTSLVAST